MQTDDLDLRCCDCMELMEEYPDNWFDLAIVDPPYGGILNKKNGHGSLKEAVAKYGGGDWDYAPDTEYFNELRRVSKNQICWGANHYISKMPYDSPCWIFWDKVRDTQDFADGEFAWSSFTTSASRFVFAWDGFRQGDMKNKETRIHPTQKPVKLYDWLLSKYAEKGQKILDTHMGSGSIAIACHYAQCHLTASELDEDYFNAACERIERETRQQTLFV